MAGREYSDRAFKVMETGFWLCGERGFDFKNKKSEPKAKVRQRTQDFHLLTSAG